MVICSEKGRNFSWELRFVSDSGDNKKTENHRRKNVLPRLEGTNGVMEAQARSERGRLEGDLLISTSSYFKAHRKA